KKAVESDDVDTIKAATEKLTEIVQQLSVKLYEQAQAQAGDGADAGQANSAQDDNVVDAEYEVVDDDKK
ncbi:MAG TPA: molecular chaperone DnaK, partial [Paenibacillus sp.]